MNALFLQPLLWMAAVLIAYVFVGYPLLLALVARPRAGVPSRITGELPRLTLLISAYNEKAVIEEKLKNALASDYPKELLEIIVISDCSDDGTDEIVLRYAPLQVRLVKLKERVGKSAGLNLGVQQASGDVLVFSDANAIYQQDAVRMLVRQFSDLRVGYVVGNARYVEHAGQAPSAESEGLYWKLETWLKQKESDFGSVVGGDGAIYAIRRELFTPLRPTDINDFLNPLQIIICGFRGAYDRKAVCYEEAGDSFEKEFRRKTRIISRSLNAICRAPRVLLPWTQPRHWIALISHKVLRWFIPFFLLILFFTSLCLWHIPFYAAAFGLQLTFYFLAVLGWYMGRSGKCPRILYLPYYFCLVNLASLLGVLKFLTGSLSPTWQTIRQASPTESETTVQFGEKRP
jgi:cellulose synthase/poly-beta-1,6-N-acetylglucosamine synthase-like glycosyltransferase